MNPVLAEWNTCDEATAMEAMIACCGASRWAAEMVARRPISDLTSLSATADHVWERMEEPDWMEAFACHPRIGEQTAQHASEQSAAWSTQEQSSTAAATVGLLTEVAEMNSLYEERFGFTYIVCATGKSVEEMLSIVKRRFANDRETELREAAEQQRRILQIRLRKWLAA
jgi:2-oxo-4-hydroxy-4-carboxy-5-ureidoimidazoline decarboxylase